MDSSKGHETGKVAIVNIYELSEEWDNFKVLSFEKENEPALWVGLYMPTTLHWKEKGVTIKQDCLWPAQHSAAQFVGEYPAFSILHP